MSTFRRARWIAAFAVMVCAVQLTAQTFDLDRGRERVVSLDGMWRFHAGDSPVSAAREPVWAQPGFDDATWQLLKSGQSWSVQGHAEMGGYGWYRFRVLVPPGNRLTSLLFAPILTSYQVYVDGQLVGQCGKMPAPIPSYSMSYHQFPLTRIGSPVERSVQVAIRVWHAPIWASYVGGGPLEGGHLVGDPALLAVQRVLHQKARDVFYVDSYSYSITAALVGLAILCLFLIRPREREYLWFAIMLLAQAADNALYVCQQIYSKPPLPINDLLDGMLVAVNFCAALCFFSRVLDARIGKTGRLAVVLAAFSPFAAVFYWPQWASPSTSASIQIVCLAPVVLWILAVLLRRAWRGDLDARLLLVPTGLDLGFYFADNVAIVLDQAGITHVPRIFEVPLPLPPFSVQSGTLLHLFFLLALLVFLTRRFALARRREERLAGELDAAREVQQVLLPDEQDQCPAFAVESVYQPAEQVGGDFFQQIADGSGGISIVIGDVSGKGLPAAMLVSVLVGAIRAEAEHRPNPAALLQSLNRRVAGRMRGGFTTCLAAHLASDGKLTAANAGHLPPYLNGEEMEVHGSLPLGIDPHAEYQCSFVQLAPGDQLAFVSDGVVEAQSTTGELLGFDRTRSLSRLHAAEIARAAQAFGQRDDITVVTVEVRGVPVQIPAAF
ncbi:MAG TPA: SpoIIE family protein phosphatase [Acidobacteriaceae bacterium]|nr:SpoIIE family protein phosphatase [Acidobacteriaceae bacterium]